MRQIIQALVGAGLILALAWAANYALASTTYPPVAYLAGQLGLASGQQLPKGVIYNGHPFYFYIVGAHERGNGRYIVELQAR